MFRLIEYVCKRLSERTRIAFLSKLQRSKKWHISKRNTYLLFLLGEYKRGSHLDNLIRRFPEAYFSLRKKYTHAAKYIFMDASEAALHNCAWCIYENAVYYISHDSAQYGPEFMEQQVVDLINSTRDKSLGTRKTGVVQTSLLERR